MFRLPLFALITLLTLLTLVAAADFYKTLGVHKSASDKDIRYAYKKLSKKFHPDKNKDPDAEAKFVEIAHAYEVLSSAEKRQIYDRYGEEGLKAHEGGQHTTNPFDIFSSFFGGGYRTEQTRKGPTSVSEFEVPLADMYGGAEIDFQVRKRILCDHCRGSGAATDSDIHTCPGCSGHGVKVVKQQVFPGMYAQSQVTCNDCNGRGKVVKRACPLCGGDKVIEHTQELHLEITPGMPEGHEVVFEGEADESPDWEAGDIVIRVRSKKDTGAWRRKESSLYWRETISIDEALLGFERNVTHLDRHIVKLSRQGVTQPGFVQVIKGEGMPDFGKSTHGDLFIQYNVVLPTDISPQMRKKLIEAFHEFDGHDEL